MASTWAAGNSQAKASMTTSALSVADQFFGQVRTSTGPASQSGASLRKGAGSSIQSRTRQPCSPAS